MALNGPRKLDFLIAGSTPMAMLLAHFLRRSHKCEVGLLADDPHPLRVSRGFDVSVSPLTRPESWELLKRCTSEVKRAISGWDRALLEATDVAMTGHGEAAKTALGHIRHMSAAFGVLSEPLTGETVVRHGGGFVVRGATRLKRRHFSSQARNVLEKFGADWLPLANCQMEWGSGRVRLDVDGETIEAENVILCDAELAAQISPAVALPSELQMTEHCGLLTEPGAKPGWQCLLDIANEGLACSHADGRTEAWVRGDRSRAERWLAGVLEHGSQTRLSGYVAKRSVASVDGAPIVARMGRSSIYAALNFGMSEVFFTPALARYFAGHAHEFERAYFEPRGSGNKRGAVSEFTSAEPGI